MSVRKLSFFFILVVITLLSPKEVFADRVINSVTLNGSSSVSVAPSASITASVNVTTNTLNDKNWRSTSWNITGSNCINHTDHNGAGTYSENFTVTAPSGYGTYNISFVAFADSACSIDASPTYTLTGGIIIPSPTPTPTPTSSPTPTSTVGPGTPTSSPTPTSTMPSTSGSVSSPSANTVIYPSITLSNQGLLFSGTASISHGVIDSVEFSFDDGNVWQKATAIDGEFNETFENYTFSPGNTFTIGTYKVLARAKSLANVYTQVSNYAGVTFTVTPPKVTVDDISPNPTKNQTPTITGRAISDFTKISNVQISLDGGRTWFFTKLVGYNFSLTTKPLEDGNYNVVARAYDNYGNVGVSKKTTLVIDTIPPIIGGSMFWAGAIYLSPDKNGDISTVSGSRTNLTLSLRGGVTSGFVQSGDLKFPLIKRPKTNLWTADLIYNQSTSESLSVEVVDGAGNKTTRRLNKIIVEESGSIYEKSINSNFPIGGADVYLYYFDSISKNWVLWEGSSFGQDNPKVTDNLGKYSFIVPPGKYYLEIKKTGYKTIRSQIFERSENTLVNFNLSLSPRTKIALKFPLVGNITITLPDLNPIKTFGVKFDEKTEEIRIHEGVGTLAPDIKMTTENGKPVFVSLKDKYILSFVSIWSKTSQEQIPILSEVNRKLSDDVKLLVVFLQDTASASEIFVKRGNYTFNYLADKNGELAEMFSINTLPQHFFINSSGIIQNIQNEVLTETELLEKISKLD